jgi:hypothetical protein
LGPIPNPQSPIPNKIGNYTIRSMNKCKLSIDLKKINFIKKINKKHGIYKR